MSKQIITIRDTNNLQAELLTQSTLICRSVIGDIIRKARVVIAENYAETITPQFSIAQCAALSETIITLATLDPDSYILTMDDDDVEPASKVQDCWRSYIATIDHRTYQSSMHISTHTKTSHHHYHTRSSVRIDKATKQPMEYTQFNPNIQDMTIPQVEDPNEDRLRIAFESQLLQKQQNQAILQLCIQEKKEEQRQMRIMANSIMNSKAYTYDYEGKLMAQNYPKLDSNAPNQQKASVDVKFLERNVVIDFGKSFAKLSIKSDSKKESKPHVKFETKLDVNLIDRIEIAKGVTIHEGYNQKSGPTFTKDHTKNSNDKTYIQSQLQDPNFSIQMTKKDYEILVGSGVKISKPLGSDISQRQTTRRPETLPEQSKRNLNSSINQSIMGGSIRINNSNIDDLIITDDAPILPKILRKQSSTLAMAQEQLNLLVNSNMKEIQRGSAPKLPKVMQCNKSLPYLPKNPRQRVFSQVELSAKRQSLI